MEEEENKEISNEVHTEVKKHKKKKKKKHKKTSSSSNIQPKEETNEEPKIDSNENNVNEENKEETRTELNKQEEKKEIITPDEVQPETKTEEKENNDLKEKEELNQEIKEETELKETSKKTKGKKKKRGKSKKKIKKEKQNMEEKIEENCINSDNNINSPEKEKIDVLNNINNDDENNNLYPEKEINPTNLIKIDEDDGEVDYLHAEQAYELSVLLESHKFIRNVKNLDKTFINLIRRQIIRYERNLYDLILNNNKFFILYELQVSKNPNISLLNIMILDTIKSIMNSYPDIHLIIFISDLEYLNNNNEETNSSLLDNYSKEKLSNVLIYLNLDSDNEKRIHAISSGLLLSKNEDFKNQKDNFKKLINKKRVLNLFNLPIKEENDSILEYPCCLSISADPSIYTKYIPEITSDFKCLIINSIFYLNRYQLCFSASKALSFPEPSIIALKVIPPLKDIMNIDEENLILNSDDNSSLINKIKIMNDKENGNKINLGVFYNYLAFLEEDKDLYEKIIKNYEEEKENEIGINEKIVELIQNKFNIFKEKNIKDIDINKFTIENY